MNETLEDILAIAASGQAAAYVLKGCNGWTRKPGQKAKLSDRAMVFAAYPAS